MTDLNLNEDGLAIIANGLLQYVTNETDEDAAYDEYAEEVRELWAILPHYLSHHKQNPALWTTERESSRPGGITSVPQSSQIYEDGCSLRR